MSRTTSHLAAAALVALGACGGTSRALLRVRPPPLELGDSAEAQRLRVESAVRDVAAMGRLACKPPREGSVELLECWPDNLGDSPAFVSLHLQGADDGYAVKILESFPGLRGPRQLCSIQDRLAERLDTRLGGGEVKRDPLVTCPARAR